MLKEKIYSFRRKGLSYRQIESRLGISKGTISYWLRRQNWSIDIQKRLQEKARKNASDRMRLISLQAKKIRESNYDAARKEARRTFLEHRNDPLFMACLSIYWGEGDQGTPSSLIRVANTDPSMLRMFRTMFTKYLGIPLSRLRAYLILYEDLNVKDCELYWAKQLGIPTTAFFKSHVIKGRHRTKKLPWGVCTLTFSSRQKKEMLLEWLRLIKKRYSVRV